MNSISETHLRKDFVEVSDRVCADHSPILITRQGAPSLVMMSFDDYRALEETVYLMRSPRNAARLREAIDDVAAGRVGRPTPDRRMRILFTATAWNDWLHWQFPPVVGPAESTSNIVWSIA